MKRNYFMLNAKTNKLESIVIDDDCFIDDCYKYIGCRCFDIVDTSFRDVVMIIDDEGAIIDNPVLNLNASKLYPGFGYSFIYGNAIIAQRSPEGYIVPVDYELMSFIISIFGFDI